MRVAAKYAMDDVQRAIVRVINSSPSASEIAQLAFIAEFPGHFHKSTFKKLFVQACSTDRRPSGHDLQPLMAFPHLVALMMQYREGIIQPNQAIWNERASLPSPRGFSGFGAPAAALPATSMFAGPISFGQPPVAPRGSGGLGGFGTSSAGGSREDNWLDEQIGSLGLAPFLVAYSSVPPAGRLSSAREIRDRL